MTTAQKFKFYFPAWGECCRANGWRMEHGRLQGLEEGHVQERNAVLRFARQLAAREHRGPVMDDLRHAAHMVALGRDKSSADLTNAEVDRVVTLFRLLTDPDDLAARMAWDHPEEEQRAGYVRYLRTLAPEAVLRAIARSTWGTPDWEDRDVSGLRWLVRTLKDRAARKHSVAANASARDELDPDWNV